MNVRLASARAVACWVAVASVGLLAGCSSSTPAASSSAPASAAASSAAAPASSAAAPASSAAAPVDANVVNPGADPLPVLAGGTGDISGPGVTATEIKIGQIATETGPMPGMFEGSILALQAFANYVNDQGGILGRQLVIDQQDDAFDCATYTNELKSMSKDVFAMVGTWSNQDGCGQDFLAANPDFANIQGYILNPALYEVPNAFSGLTAPPGQRNAGYLWVKDQFPDAMSKGAYLFSTYVPTTGDSVKKAGESGGCHVDLQPRHRLHRDELHGRHPAHEGRRRATRRSHGHELGRQCGILQAGGGAGLPPGRHPRADGLRPSILRGRRGPSGHKQLHRADPVRHVHRSGPGQRPDAGRVPQ